MCNVVFGSFLLKKLEVMFSSLDLIRVSVRAQLLITFCWKYLSAYHVFSVFILYMVWCFIVTLWIFPMIFYPFLCCLVLVVCKCVTSLTTLGKGGGEQNRPQVMKEAS